MNAATHSAGIAGGVAAPLVAWRRGLTALTIVMGAILLLFLRDVGDIVALWWTSSTFEHCLLILPIIVWLIVQRSALLRQLTPRPWLPGLMVVGVGAFGWMLGDAAGVALARHFGLIIMLQGAVIACLGPTVSRAIAFPLFYALFLVPAGEELVAPLQTVTAKFCMFLLDVAGVPARIEGVFITIPNGYFEVAEACSGVKFLIAMIALGALAANICFRSWPRRILFMAACVIVPIIANGLRAWGTIYMSHLTSADFAAGFDHVVYGWIFFAVVIVLVLVGGWPFFDRGVDDPWFDPAKLEPVPPSADHPRKLPLVAFAAIAIAVAPIAWSSVATAGGRNAVPSDVALPELPGWRKVRSEGKPWMPRFSGADRLLIERYVDRHGNHVDLAVAIFASQAEGREVVGYGQGAIDPGSDWAWTDARPAPADGQAFRITAPGPVVREVVTFYRVGDIVTGSETRVKLETLKARLLGGPQRAVAVIVSAEQPDRAVSVRPAIDAFLRDLGSVARLADNAAGMR